MRDYYVGLTNLTTNMFIGNFIVFTSNEANAIIGAIQQAGLYLSGNNFSASVYFILPNGVHSQSVIVTHQTLF